MTIASYYGNGSSAQNNAKCVTLNGTSFYFSYQTLVGIKTPSELVVIQNYWSSTTAKHLNAIDGGNKKNRVTADEFKAFVNSLPEDTRNFAKELKFI